MENKQKNAVFTALLIIIYALSPFFSIFLSFVGIDIIHHRITTMLLPATFAIPFFLAYVILPKIANRKLFAIVIYIYSAVLALLGGFMIHMANLDAEISTRAFAGFREVIFSLIFFVAAGIIAISLTVAIAFHPNKKAD